MKKTRKSRILASQTHPETLPKSIQNRYSKKHTFFLQFLNEFCHMLQWLNLKIRAPTQCFVNFSHKCLFRFLHALLVQKPSKNLFKSRSERRKNRCQNRVVFSSSIFRGLDPFWRVSALQVGAKLAALDSQTCPPSLQNPIFWEHMAEMLPKRLQSGP